MRSRMFHLWQDKRIKTWNPFVGCRFNCSYCWARRMARRFRCELCKSFEPHFHPERLSKIPKSGIVFVSDMGDISFAPDSVLGEIVYAIVSVQERHDAIFFFETKNPSMYVERPYDGWDHGKVLLPSKTIFSTTIETNRDELVRAYSLAPPPSIRAEFMKEITFMRKHVSIEPIMDFDLKTLFKWVTDIEPECVSIGYDNYNNHLPEPPLPKTLKLIEDLENSGIKVERKTLRGIT